MAGWLSLAQHYGLPTRLLDWTATPLIAAFFALERYIEDGETDYRDACIWVLNPYMLNQTSIGESVTPSIEAPSINKHLWPAFSNRALEKNDVVAVMGAENDIRLFVQQGAFTIHSRKTPLEADPDYAEYVSRIMIPSEAIPTIADELATCGYRRGNIYPDLGNLASELVSTFG